MGVLTRPDLPSQLVWGAQLRKWSPGYFANLESCRSVVMVENGVWSHLEWKAYGYGGLQRTEGNPEYCLFIPWLNMYSVSPGSWNTFREPSRPGSCSSRIGGGGDVLQAWENCLWVVREGLWEGDWIEETKEGVAWEREKGQCRAPGGRAFGVQWGWPLVHCSIRSPLYLWAAVCEIW